MINSPSLNFSSGVEYTVSSKKNPNFPEGQTTLFEAELGLDPASPEVKNGIDKAGEFLKVSFSLAQGQTFDDVIAAIGNGTLRMGLHVQSIGCDGGPSDSYVNQKTAVPIPGAAYLMGSGLIALLGLRRKRSS